MCYICNFCGKSQANNISAHKVVTQYRMFQHPNRPKAIQRQVIKNGKKKMEWIPDPGGIGLQVAKEVLACPTCNLKWERDQREKQGLPADAHVPKVVLPLLKPKEITPEPIRRVNRPPFRNQNRRFQRD